MPEVNTLKPRSIKISDAVWTAWQAEATKAGLSVTALIIARMSDKPSTVSKSLARSGPKQLDLDTAYAEIANLKRELAMRPEPEVVLSPNKWPIRGKPTLADVAKHPKVAGTVKAVSSKPVPARTVNRGDIDASVHHPVGPVLADPVPRAIPGQAVGFNPKRNWKAPT